MLATVAGWLVFRRLVYGPAWWLVWLPLRVIFGVGKGVGSAVVKGREDVEEGRVEVGGNEKVAVEGLPKKDIPTAKVGGEEEGSKVDPDSMVEKVGKVVDEGAVVDDEPPLDASVPEVKMDGDQADARPKDEL